ncbi:MAG: hypothetical protein ACKO7O_06630 [Bacteroidota bacterium]|jgi:hypothetical protein
MLRKLVLFLFVFNLAADVFAQGCSQCKLLAEQSSGLDESAFSSNMNFGILYLMAFPYLILMFIFRKPLLRFFKSILGQAPSQ